jgi:hypothetical protein
MFSDMAPSNSGAKVETYPYSKNIRAPKSLHMGTSGSLPQLGRNLDGLVDYVEVLITGKGASATGRPLGNKYFMKTGAKCKDEKTKKDVPRYLYINNVPEGGIPMMPDVMGIKMKSFRGLIPGAISNMEALNPMSIMSAFTTGSTPSCQAITMETIDTNNRTGSDTQFVANADIKDINPCSWGSRGTNPVTGEKCSEGFIDNIQLQPNIQVAMPNDVMAQIYFVCLGLLIIYMMYCLMTRNKK